MLVSLDGGLTFQEAKQGVRVLYREVPFSLHDEETEGDVLFNFSEEGIITDLWMADSEEALGGQVNIATEGETVDELANRLIMREGL
jgi:hypothetical protein